MMQARSAACVGTALILLSAAASAVGSTIDPANPHAYAANVGWVNAWADGAHGAMIGHQYCGGFMYAANVGWIKLGAGAPANGYAYANISGTDWGLNHDGAGRLTGYAWAQNLGWLVFEQTHGKPMVDLVTGHMSGHAWCPNAGWLAFSGLSFHVKTGLDTGPNGDGDAIPDPWEFQKAGGPGLLGGGGADYDHDGVSDEQEYAGDTNPTGSNDFLRIASLSRGGGSNQVTWTCRDTRLYMPMAAPALGAWTNAVSGPILPPIGATVMTQTESAAVSPARFHRVKAIVPLPCQ
jgi:hypothetical protein